MSRTPRTALIGAIRRAGWRGARGRLPGNGAWPGAWRERESLRRHTHEYLALAGGLEEVAEADNRRDERGLGGALRPEASEGGDASLEAGVHGLQAIPGRALEHDGEQPLLHQVLGDDQLL